MAASALIGHTGFVGSNLARQMQFDEFYNSKNIDDIRGREFDLVVCAGAPGAKWRANADPDADGASVKGMAWALCDVETKRLVLISTVDAINPVDAYGILRGMLEEFVKDAWENTCVIRLPALFGPGMKKNALYDLMTAQRLAEIAPNASYQWYPLRRLGADIARIRESGKRVVNITSAPIMMDAIRARFFPRLVIGSWRDDAPIYNVSGDPDYSLTRAEVFAEMEAFLAGNA